MITISAAEGHGRGVPWAATKLECMADPQEVLAGRVRTALAAAFGTEYADADPVIRPSAFADYQANVALSLAKRLGRPPREVAAEIASHLDLADVCEKVEVSGPGFINFTLRTDWIANQATGMLGDGRLWVPAADPAQKIVVDYSSPNVSKEMHVGHLRTTVVGDAIVRILEYQGHDVIRANHLGDWGTQFGLLIEHLMDVGEDTARRQLAAGDINTFYQAARVKFDSDPAFADRSRHRVVLLQSGDKDTLRLWRVLVDQSKQYYNTIYGRLGITLTDDDLAPESFYNAMLASVCDELQRDGIAVISNGALCAFPPGFTGRDGEPLPMILRKSDGGYGYDTTDLAAIRYRIRDLKANRLIYVVGAEQSLHFRMLFAVARQAGWLTDEISAEHAVIGLVGDPALRQEIAEAVGIGALKYGDLSVARDSGYVFDFDRMLALTGNTGPYLQYATARIRSIFRRAGLDPGEATSGLHLTEDAERALALTALGFGAAVGHASDGAEPHVLAAYLFDVASTFTAFYEQCPVLNAPTPELRASRLALSALTLRILTTGLGLLEIPVPERM